MLDFRIVGNELGMTYTYVSDPILKQRKWISVDMSQTLMGNKYINEIVIDRNLVHTVEMHQPSAFHDVMVNTSSIYLPVNGYIQTLVISPHHTTGTPKPSCKCGMKREMENRIVGGDNTEVNEYPWMVLIYLTKSKEVGDEYSCGGSLIADQWVVSAAHCFELVRKNEIIVVLGEHDTSMDIEANIQRKEFKVQKIVQHEKYNKLEMAENDISLLKLSTKVNLNIYTPICLPKPNDDFTIKKHGS
eukprot:TRINITY_DN16161_c0_g1_i1.p1 TRINITY_DN16161_c0_g1~~TRINITY_DN16161_c0_g1_i1.p1  ORF type:complete len:245 (-),score=25.13 TRINITY_DN16161_c0_g1_i1:174-908(-)